MPMSMVTEPRSLHATETPHVNTLSRSGRHDWRQCADPRAHGFSQFWWLETESFRSTTYARSGWCQVLYPNENLPHAGQLVFEQVQSSRCPPWIDLLCSGLNAAKPCDCSCGQRLLFISLLVSQKEPSLQHCIGIKGDRVYALLHQPKREIWVI